MCHFAHQRVKKKLLLMDNHKEYIRKNKVKGLICYFRETKIESMLQSAGL